MNENHDERGRFAASGGGNAHHKAMDVISDIAHQARAFVTDESGTARANPADLQRAVELADKVGLTDPMTAGEIPGTRIFGELMKFLTVLACIAIASEAAQYAIALFR